MPLFEGLETRRLFSFVAPVSYAPGTTASAVAVSDFNNDGINDVVQLNAPLATLNVMLGNGDGTFQAPISSPAGGSGMRMAIGDFNHDGIKDIVTCQGYSLALELGNGDGSFRSGGFIYVGAYANDVQAGDVNHDGFDDIATASFSYGGTTQLFVNNGALGGFTGRNLAIGPTGNDIEMGDVNDDGNVDLIEQGGIYNEVLIGAGDGTFSSTPYSFLSGIPQDVQVGDFNHDGMADLLVTTGTSVSIYAGNATGIYNTPSGTNLALSGASRVQIGDVNGDGNNDIVTNNGLAVLGRGDGGFFVATGYGNPTGSAMALGDFNGDGAPDVVTAAPLGTAGGVSVALNGNNDVQLLAGASLLAVSTSGNAIAGSPFAVTITALDASGNVVTGFQGSVAISGAPGTQPVYYTFTAADNGVHTVPNAAKFFTGGVGTYSVMSPFLPTATGTINVLGAAATKFSVTAQGASLAGDTASVTVTAIDAYGNATSGYLGTLHFSSSDLQAGLPADYTFTLGDGGSHTFDVVLRTSGAQSVTATDILTGTVTGTSNAVAIAAAPATSLSLTGGGGYIGSVNAVQITARDQYGNVDTNYNGLVHLATSDASSTTSADATLINGVGTFTVTPMTLGTQTLTASDPSNGLTAASESIMITPGWGARFVTTPLSATTAGQTQTTTLTVYDLFGDVSTVYSGYVAVTSTDPRAPFSYVYVSPADAGVKTIPVTLYTAGVQAVTISDYTNPGVTVTQPGINVSPSAPVSLSVTPLVPSIAGNSQNATVSALDAYGNVASGYLGTLNFASSDTLAALPADYTYTAADAGTHMFSVAFKTAGGQSITVSDTANATAFNYFQKDIMVSPATLNSFAFKGASISNTTAGATFSLTVSATDAYGNAITGYTGKALFTSSDSQISMPSSYTFTSADGGSHTFSVALKTAGSESITATDSANGAITGTLSAIAVKAAAAAKASIATSASATSGTAQAVTVTITDAYGNVATGYTGTVKFSSSDAQATLPANYTFTNKDGGVHTFNVTFRTSGSQSISVADSVNAGIAATQGGIAVTASTAAVASFTVSGFPATAAGASKTFTVTARDASGNIVSGYTGTVSFSSSDVKAGLPASYTFTSADGGSHTFSATLKTAGSQSITVKDASNGTIVGSQSGIVVSPAAAAQFVISAPTSVTQGVGFKFTMTVLDAYGNVATNYRGSVHLSSTDTKAGSSNYTFSRSDNGVHLFSYTFPTLGTQTLTVTDTTNSSVTASWTMSVLSK